MRAIVYDVSMISGAGCIVAGVDMIFGHGPAVLVAGVLIIALTLLAAGARR